MQRVLLVALFACGAPAKPPPTSLSNKEPSATPASDSGDARVVMRSKGAGVIELIGDREKAMSRATDEMAKHCGANNYAIVQEGEEAIGTDTTGGKTHTQTAWRVHYQCAQ